MTTTRTFLLRALYVLIALTALVILGLISYLPAGLGPDGPESPVPGVYLVLP